MPVKTVCVAVILLMCSGGISRSTPIVPFKYTLELQRASIEKGYVDAIRLSLMNTSGADITLFRPQFVLRVEGPGGQDQWPIESESAPRRYDIPNGRSVFIWGNATKYYPVSITGEARAGTYVLQYCDVLRVEGTPKEVCSNRVVLHIEN